MISSALEELKHYGDNEDFAVRLMDDVGTKPSVSVW